MTESRRLLRINPRLVSGPEPFFSCAFILEIPLFSWSALFTCQVGVVLITVINYKSGGEGTSGFLHDSSLFKPHLLLCDTTTTPTTWLSHSQPPDVWPGTVVIVLTMPLS